MVDSKTVEAVQKAIEESKKLERKFKQSVDVVINLKNIDMNDAKNRIEDEVMLPHGRGIDAKLALFASGDLALKSKTHVDLLIKPEEIEELAKDKKKFKKIADEYDFFIAEAPLMPTIGKTLGIILGPRGKMPKPVPPNIDIANMAKSLRKTVKVRSKTTKTIHAIVGREEMDAQHIADNIDAILKRLEGKLERGKLNIGSVYVKTSMGPPMRIL
ncbi:MAG: 50S ribosomal protein L1 [Thermoplasmata archaeon]|nr:50S ribosomal protein L1 [Thermoplasmata archaeon]MBE3136271.1 50S ribosomal protein L1 [Thermoplasmata archaeon]MBE3138997.1 50S ribosomal protein L1 [Thermoplasmata archaeon]